MSQEITVVEKMLPAKPEVVWQALTDAKEMKNWYFDIPDFQPVVGFTFSFFGQGKKGASYKHLCRVTEVVPLEKLQHTWSYEGYPGESYVTFELEGQDGGTRVRLSHSGLDSFPQDNPDFDKANFAEGWNYIIGTSLKEYLEKKAG
ncbi:MAG: SRPBCC family protein [Flavisolibacter sp.]